MTTYPSTRVRGAALLLVLWLIALLTSVIGMFALNARIEHLQGSVASRGMVATEAARAGLEYAITRVAATDPARQWVPDGREYRWRFGDADLRIRVLDESGKIDLNVASPTLLAGLLAATGGKPQDATALAAAIVDWRDVDNLKQPQGGAEDPDYAAAGLPYGAKDAPFETVPEVEQVLGMTPAVYARIAPYLTVYSGLAVPNQNFASDVALRAMGIDPPPELARRTAAGPNGAPVFVGGSGTYSIDSRARLANGREAQVRAVVRTGASRVPGSAYAALRWQEGASAQQ